MRIIKRPAEMSTVSRTLRKSGKTIGLVPTMGALHDGHLSLLKIARKRCDVVVMSIFVNPIQFGPNEDLAKYPRPFETDVKKAGKNGCDIVFAPDPANMYPKPFLTYVDIEDITTRLCGLSRPGHFRGVATVVLKLFNIVEPDCAVFGQKDAQQVVVIRRMVDDLNVQVKLVVAPTIREPDGLAMSSRNTYLTPEEREKAPAIQSGLRRAASAFAGGERKAAALRNAVADEIAGAGLLQVEYVEAVDAVSLMPLETIEGRVLLAVACRTAQSRTRLIDNIVLGGAL